MNKQYVPWSSSHAPRALPGSRSGSGGLRLGSCRPPASSVHLPRRIVLRLGELPFEGGDAGAGGDDGSLGIRLGGESGLEGGCSLGASGLCRA